MTPKETAYQIENVESPEKERVSNINIPIIDIIRHGKTDYKELNHPDFAFNPRSKSFKLDAKHLDLNEPGRQEIDESAEQLIEKIDKENEVVLLISSKAFRAHSSILLIQKKLQEAGITVLNPDIFIAENLKPINFKNQDTRTKWIEQDKPYRQEDISHTREHPEQAHQNIAQRLGKKITDIFDEDYDKIDLRFQRFLRHMNNINCHLQDKTKQLLKNKRLRIICLSHEEVPDRFITKTLGAKENLKNGQILEIQPADYLENNTSNENRIILYPKGDDSESGEAKIIRRFSTKGQKG